MQNIFRILAVSCPTGTQRDGADVKNLSECNSIQDDSLMTVANSIPTTILGVLGIVAVIVIIAGGYMYMTSGGDPAKAKKGKDAIMYAVIGLVVATLAWAIISFVTSNIK